VGKLPTPTIQRLARTTDARNFVKHARQYNQSSGTLVAVVGLQTRNGELELVIF
jgi:hypothetical protein